MLAVSSPLAPLKRLGPAYVAGLISARARSAKRCHLRQRLTSLAILEDGSIAPAAGEMEGEPEGSPQCTNWWRRGRIELPVQKKAPLDILQA